MNIKINGGDIDNRFVFRVGTARDVEAFTVSNGATQIQDTGTAAMVGDIIRFEDGAYQYIEAPVTRIIDANNFEVGADLPNLIVGNTFFILRQVTQRTDDTGAQVVITSSGPVQFVLDGVDTEVEQDTVVPANSIPLPVIQLDAAGLPVDYATETTLAAMSAKLPATIGQKASAASLAVALSTEQEAEIGAINEATPVLDTDPSGLNGALKRIAARLSSIILQLPATIGQKASAASLAVVLSTEQEGLIGALTETAPATDTASSGLNGRLQRIAQNLSALILQLPATIGQKIMAQSLSVTIASDQAAIPSATAGKTYNSSGRIDYSSVNILSASWTLLLTMPATDGTAIMVFDSGGYALELGIGNAGSETRVLVIPPGGLNGPIPLFLPASSKISLRGLEVPTVNVGQFIFTILS